MNSERFHIIFESKYIKIANLILLLEHCLYGSPSKPGGHAHVARWFFGEQMALTASGETYIIMPSKEKPERNCSPSHELQE